MSYLKTRAALIQHLLNSNISYITSADIAYDDKSFDPSSKDNWVSAYFRASGTAPTGKSTSDSDVGFFQVNINSQTGNYDIDTLTIMEDVATAFRVGSTVSYQGQNVEILNISGGEVGKSGGFWRRILTINYSTFSAR